ncbi:MAG TPA: radical SAM protein, partial [Polyangia bacterium]|nr:radical SAM protein [Polyangia bacterium]
MSTDLSVAVPTMHGPRSTALHVRSELPEQRFPIAAGLELTFRCNLACIHCYVNLPAADREAKTRELTTEEWFRILDECADAGVLWLTLTGGEPLLRPDFCEIYEYAHDKGMVTTVFTNATLITERHVEMWRRRPPRALEITQYGWTPETYDKVTDAGPQYDRFQRGFQRVRQAGIPVVMKAIAMRASVHELPAIRDFARAEGLSFNFDAVLSPRIDGGKKPLAQRLTPAEVAAIEEVDDARAHAFADHCNTYVGQRSTDDHKYRCGAGTNMVIVDPYGKMHVCQLSRRPGWDVLRDGLADGFYKAFTAIREERRDDTAGCASCATASACSNCVGMAELESRSIDFGDSYFC